MSQKSTTSFNQNLSSHSKIGLMSYPFFQFKTIAMPVIVDLFLKQPEKKLLYIYIFIYI